jgi:hypothetical protein
MTTDAKPQSPLTNERPTPAERVQKSFRRNKKRGRRWAGFGMSIAGGLVGCIYGIGSGMKEVITELLPEDEDEEDGDL